MYLFFSPPGNRPDDIQCARIYFNDSPKPPPYSLHHLHPPEYHEDPPPRYMTPIPAPDYNTIPGTTADDHMWLTDPCAFWALFSNVSILKIKIPLWRIKEMLQCLDQLIWMLEKLFV